LCWVYGDFKDTADLELSLKLAGIFHLIDR
jgi:hypothetical protein